MGDPAEYQLAIEKDYYVHCLNIYREDIWNQRLDKMESELNEFDDKDVELLEQIYENFTIVKMAANGRINIPSDFLGYANIKKDVVLSGMGKVIKLWNAEDYKKRKSTRSPLGKMIKEKLGNNPTENE